MGGGVTILSTPSLLFPHSTSGQYTSDTAGTGRRGRGWDWGGSWGGSLYCPPRHCCFPIQPAVSTLLTLLALAGEGGVGLGWKLGGVTILSTPSLLFPHSTSGQYTSDTAGTGRRWGGWDWGGSWGGHYTVHPVIAVSPFNQRSVHF